MSIKKDNSIKNESKGKPEKIQHSNSIVESNDFGWYVIQVHSNFEKAIIEEIKNKIDINDLKSEFKEFYYANSIVKDPYTKKEKEKMLYPGYIFVKMKLNNKTWNTMTKTDRVVTFVGSNKFNPMKLTDTEYKKMIEDIKQNEEKKSNVTLAKGDTVRIKDGSFQSLTCVINEIQEEKKKVEVLIRIFGKETFMALDFEQVEKVQ